MKHLKSDQVTEIMDEKGEVIEYLVARRWESGSIDMITVRRDFAFKIPLWMTVNGIAMGEPEDYDHTEFKHLW